MVKISDCSCECRDKGKEQQIEERALSSINKILGTEGQAYYPDGTGAVTIPIADADQLAQIGINAEDITALERSQEKASSDIAQMKISISENAGEIEKIQTVSDAQAREIAGIKADDRSRDTEIAGLKTRVTATEGDISDIQTVDAGQTTEINGLKTKTSQQATQISGLDALCESITKSLVTDVEVGVGTDAGSFIVSVVEEDGTRRSSDSFQYGRVGTFALMQGAQAGYVKGVLTLVDGTTVESNDFQILQVTASDIYVTSITLSADYQTGKIGGTIGYSNGNTAAINEILVPTAPGVASNINDLLSRMTAVEAKDRTQDASISDLTTRVKTLEATPGVGKFTNSALGTIQGSTADGKVSAGSDGTGSVNGWSTIKSDIASKASQSALNTTNAEVATKASKTELSAVDAKVGTKANQTDLTALQNATKGAFSEFSISAGADRVTVEMTALDGQSNSQTIPIVSDTAAGVVTKDMLNFVGMLPFCEVVNCSAPSLGHATVKFSSSVPSSESKLQFNVDFGCPVLAPTFSTASRFSGLVSDDSKAAIVAVINRFIQKLRDLYPEGDNALKYNNFKIATFIECFRTPHSSDVLFLTTSLQGEAPIVLSFDGNATPSLDGTSLDSVNFYLRSDASYEYNLSRSHRMIISLFE